VQAEALAAGRREGWGLGVERHMSGLVFAAALALLAPPRALAAVNLETTLKISAEERYDDDALLARDLGVAMIPGLTGQLMTKVSPQFGVSAKGRTLKAEGWYAADLVARHSSGTLSLDHRAGLDVAQRFSDRLRLDADLRFWRVSDPTSLPRTGVAPTLSPVLYGVADLWGGYRLAERWTVRLGYRFEGARIYDASRDLGTVHAPAVEAWYRATGRLELGADGRAQFFQLNRERSRAQTVGLVGRYRIDRETQITARAGPILFSRGTGDSSLMPRALVELSRERDGLMFAASVGHDLIGASGFNAAVWADWASLMAEWRPRRNLGVFGAVNLYRNGAAPDVGWLSGPHVSTGYGMGGGLDWTFARGLTAQLRFDRYSQLDRAVAAYGMRLERNILAVRLVWTAW